LKRVRGDQQFHVENYYLLRDGGGYRPVPNAYFFRCLGYFRPPRVGG
jgi:hypothetical protein